ncbi:MAG: hypothetical protein J5622_04630 [Firmicutes bacterium]|nr:hypothetical protein [Bacillota bacterium]
MKKRMIGIKGKFKHTIKMQRIMKAYHDNVDREIFDFVNDVLRERDALPVTVAYLSDKQRNAIYKTLHRDKTQSWEGFTFASRCIIDADAVRHIIKRHGANGKADQSMSNIEDIARMSYVLANFDEVSFDGFYSHKFYCSDGRNAPHVTFKKRIDGSYYIITAVTDAKANKSHIVSAYIN